MRNLKMTEKAHLRVLGESLNGGASKALDYMSRYSVRPCDRNIVMLILAFELIELAGERGVRGQEFAELYDGPHDVDTHRDGALN